jgi:MFS family permease
MKASPTRPSPRWTLALTSAAFFMVALDALVVATALPAIRREIHAGVGVLGWIVNAYSLTYAAGIVTAAALGDRLLQACGSGWFALTATTAASYPTLVAPLIVAGMGISMALPTTPAAALGAVAPGDVGKASGTNSTLQRFGAVFGVALATPVFSANGHIGNPASFDAGFRPALAVVAGLSLLGCASALVVAGRRGTRRRGTRRRGTGRRGTSRRGAGRPGTAPDAAGRPSNEPDAALRVCRR